MMQKVGTVRYGRVEIRYEVQYLETRRTLAIEVHPDGRVRVRAPLGCPDAVIAERVHRRAAWICRKREAFEAYRPRTPPRQYVQGESHLYLGRQYRLAISHCDAPGVKLSGDRLLVTLRGESSPGRVKAQLRSWYLDRARLVFSEVLNANLHHFDGVERPRLSVRGMRTRWGSLSRNGTMTLNVNVVRAPRPCIEYVVVHELCHAVHRDHDVRFYELLARIMPDWEQRKRRLEMALL